MLHEQIKWFLILFFCLGNGLGFAQNKLEVFPCTWDNSLPLEYLPQITCKSDFEALQQTSVKQGYSLQSIKVAFDIHTQNMYFINTPNYETHFEFCKKNLGYSGSHADYNHFEYSLSKFRKYSNITLTYYPTLDIYTFEFFFSRGELTQKLLLDAYQKLNENVFFKDNLLFLTNNHGNNGSAQFPVPSIDVSDIYEDEFESLNTGKAYGYLKVISDDNALETVSQTDILILKHVTNDLPIVAGVINESHQTPLSHINVLSINRGTPNMRLPKATESFRLKSLIGQLVYLEVKANSFTIKTTTLKEAQLFWQNQIREKTDIPFDTITKGIIPIHKLGFGDIETVGGKAANFAEIRKVKCTNVDTIYTPEVAFAIPFYYYQKHISTNGIDALIKELITLNHSDATNVEDKKRCAAIKNEILNAPIDLALIATIEEYIKSKNGQDRSFRFRSSSNTEDLDFFNGAGLYDSKTGVLNHDSKTMSHAIKTVWASLWNYRAFAERQYFSINQESVFMGVLVHRSFPNEKVNGVAVTANIIDQINDGCYFNVQIGETSIVNPDETAQCDEISVSYKKRKHKIKYLNHSSLIANNETVLSNAEIVLLIKTLMDIKTHYYTVFESDKTVEEFALEVEFKFDTEERRLYIKQVRSFPFK